MAAHQAFVHHGLLLVFLIMVLYPIFDFSTLSTAAHGGSQKIHMGLLGATDSESESLKQKQDDDNNNHNMEFFPIPETRYLPWSLSEGRKLTPFQLCSGCTCCANENNKNVCTQSACCYSITCGLPDKPYGVCAFTPKACNCTSCGA